ncbi:MAG: hypothetical protein PF588_03380 [Candidatus Kapabacteria bacterium]|jgi:serine/threonine-protein kinase RIO1|nr:hypothetical protein [Candidatus Kapabacteria bacterium]
MANNVPNNSLAINTALNLLTVSQHSDIFHLFVVWLSLSTYNTITNKDHPYFVDISSYSHSIVPGGLLVIT